MPAGISEGWFEIPKCYEFNFLLPESQDSIQDCSHSTTLQLPIDAIPIASRMRLTNLRSCLIQGSSAACLAARRSNPRKRRNTACHFGGWASATKEMHKLQCKPIKLMHSNSEHCARGGETLSKGVEKCCSGDAGLERVPGPSPAPRARESSSAVGLSGGRSASRGFLGQQLRRI